MSGNRQLTATAFVICVVLGLCGPAQCGQVTISGTVTVDGAKSGGMTLEAVSTKGQLATVTVAKDGRYTVTVDVPEVTPLALRPFDDRAWGTQAKGTLMGQAVARVSDKVRSITLDVQLRSVAMTARTIRVLTEKGNRPVAGVPVQCKVEILYPNSSEIPSQAAQWMAETADDGSFSVRVPERESGSFAFTLDAAGKGRDLARYLGRKEVSFEALRDAPALASWVVKRNALSMAIRFTWDENFSREAFRPDVGGAIFSHTVVVRGPVRKETVMNSEGVAQFYGLPPGEYAVELAEAGKVVYKVTKAPKAVTISPEGDPAAEVEISVVPVRTIALFGRVLDSSDGSPVSGAVVMAASSMVRTAKDGRFHLEGVRENSDLTIEHASYPLTHFKIAKAGDQGDIKITAFPSLSGIVLQGTNESGVPYAVLEFRRNNRLVKAVADEEGRYATNLPPGKYQLSIKQRYQPEKGKPIPAGAPKVSVYESVLDMPAEGLKRDFRVSGVGKLVIKLAAEGVGGNDGARSLIVCLLKLPDNKIAASCSVDAGKKEAILVAAEGRYQVLVAQNEQQGQLCGESVVAVGSVKEATISLGKWMPIQVTADGTVKVGKQ